MWKKCQPAVASQRSVYYFWIVPLPLISPIKLCCVVFRHYSIYFLKKVSYFEITVRPERNITIGCRKGSNSLHVLAAILHADSSIKKVDNSKSCGSLARTVPVWYKLTTEQHSASILNAIYVFFGPQDICTFALRKKKPGLKLQARRDVSLKKNYTQRQSGTSPENRQKKILYGMKEFRISVRQEPACACVPPYRTTSTQTRVPSLPIREETSSFTVRSAQRRGSSG